MREVVLTPKEQPPYGLIAECISCDVFAGRSIEEIEALPVYYGNRQGKLGDFFDVAGEPADKAGELRIIIEGDVTKTRWIGRDMSAGEIVIKGSADMYVGAWMSGGRIVVEGDVGTFSGMQMRGGELHVKGSAGDYLGCSYRGEWRGMSGGRIVVEGNAGAEVGQNLNGGRIFVRGSVDTFAGVRMKKGLLVVGSAIDRVGAQMTGGAIVVLNGVQRLLPGFDPAGDVENPEIEGESFEGVFRKYTGDHAERNARGVLYIKV
ncbi:MAG: formylmethanofuran dehydrogenase subunit C [Euryarchaeota archaeon]|nr:formylmethanofuran dehydrogenase subunit C [Euryarchaeota archaeon]